MRGPRIQQPLSRKVAFWLPLRLLHRWAFASSVEVANSCLKSCAVTQTLN